MKTLARILSIPTFLLNCLLFTSPEAGRWALMLWVPKLLAGGLAPFTGVLGFVGAVLGLLRFDWLSGLAGLLGAGVAARYVRKVTMPHDGFTQAFGSDWRTRIPPDLEARMVQYRWTVPARKPAPVEPLRDVVCGQTVDGEPLYCDLWLPLADIPCSGVAVIYLHGGGWHYADKDMGTVPFFRRLAEQGHVVLDLAYTLAPKAGFHEQIGDVKRAVAWMKAHAREYDLSPARIVLAGGSAGGLLALLAAYTPNHPELDPPGLHADTSVCGVISLYGVTDLLAVYHNWSSRTGDLLTGRTTPGKIAINTLEPLGYGSRLIPPYGRWVPLGKLPVGLAGGTPETAPDIYRLASAVAHVGPHCPPSLFLQGTHDFAGLVPQVRHLHWKLREAGVPSVYVEFPNTDHAFDLMPGPWAPAGQAAAYDIDRFLALMG